MYVPTFVLASLSIGSWMCLKAGVDVMITTVCDFCQFSAKKLAFFSKTNVMINFFSKFGFVLCQKTPIFSLNFSAKIF
jgi:hypothetical protein